MVLLDRLKAKPSPMTLLVEPKGSLSGVYWNDGAHFCTIKELKIYGGEKCIDAIQIVYEDKDGNFICSEKHGGNEGTQICEELKPNEYIISVYGYHGNIYDPIGNPTNVIRSLTFETNQRTLGPYGIEEGINFSFPTTGLIKIVGFHGSSGWYLDSIGFYFVPLSIPRT